MAARADKLRDRGVNYPKKRQGGTFLSTFLHFTRAGYGIALLVSLYVLWTFGRTDAVDLAQIAMMAVVLAFPAALGAAIARLVI
jgi:uncharacterized membrane protein